MKYVCNQNFPTAISRTSGDATCPVMKEFGARPCRQSGMNLIEIIIVVAIIGIISATAVPTYSQYIVKQRRADAQHLLQTNAQRLQRCLTLVGAYKGGCSLMTNSIEGHYTLNSTLTAQTWSLTAVAVTNGRQEQDTNCASISLSNTGQRSATGNKPDTCW